MSSKSDKISLEQEKIAEKAKQKIRLEQQKFEARINKWGIFSSISAYKEMKKLIGKCSEKDGQLIMEEEGEVHNAMMSILNAARLEFEKNFQDIVTNLLEKHSKEIDSQINSKLRSGLVSGAATGIAAATAATLATTTLTTVSTVTVTAPLFGNSILGALGLTATSTLPVQSTAVVAMFTAAQSALIGTGVGVVIAGASGVFVIASMKKSTKEFVDTYATAFIQATDIMKGEAAKAINKRVTKIKEEMKEMPKDSPPPTMKLF